MLSVVIRAFTIRAAVGRVIRRREQRCERREEAVLAVVCYRDLVEQLQPVAECHAREQRPQEVQVVVGQHAQVILRRIVVVAGAARVWQEDASAARAVRAVGAQMIGQVGAGLEHAEVENLPDDGGQERVRLAGIAYEMVTVSTRHWRSNTPW